MGRTSRKLVAAAEMVPGEDRGFVNAVAKAFDVLRCFEGYHVRLGNQEIARRTGLPKSTVSRLTYTLTRIGYLAYLPEDLKYKLGEGAAALGSGILRGMDFRVAVRPYLQDLADWVPAVCGMTIRDRADMVYIEHAIGHRAVSVNSSLGARIPIGATAAGRAYAAALGPTERAALLCDLKRHDPEQWRALTACLPRVLDIYARRGFALSIGDHIEHINGIAAALWSPAHATHFVFTIGGLAVTMNEERLNDQIGPRLLAMLNKVRDLLAGVEQQRILPMAGC
ncbi:MAG: IclR family transcriptional regulator [Alphaproteobacteria bacterium]